MKKILSILLCLCMVFGMFAVYASAEPNVVCLELSKKFHITSTGYYYEGETETPFNGEYLLYGSSHRIYIESEGTYNITLHECSMQMAGGGSAIVFNAAATVNLTVKGVCVLKSNAANVIDANGNTGCKVTLDIAENSSILFDNYYWGDHYCVDPAIEFTMSDGSAVPGTDAEGWNSAAFTVSKGEPAQHALVYSYIDDNTCGYGCEECGLVIRKMAHDIGNLAVEGGHQKQCYYCEHGFGEVSPHDYDGWYADGSDCVNYCYGCGYDHSVYDHSYVIQKVAATEYESAHTLDFCEKCGIETKTYDNTENAIIFEMYDDYGDGWNGARIAIFEKGVPVHYIALKNEGDTDEIYALPFNKDRAYSIKWFSGGGYPDEIGLSIYVPGEEDAVFDQYDMTGVAPFTELVSMGMADYSDLQSALDTVPDYLEDYTAESLASLIDAVEAIVPDLPASKQEEVDAMEEAVLDAVGGLELQEVPAVPHGIINAAAKVSVSSTGYTYKYLDDGNLSSSSAEIEYIGKYTFLGTDVLAPSTKSVVFTDGVFEADIVNLFISGGNGNIAVINAELELGVYGINRLIGAETEYYYAGLEMDNADLTIKDTQGTLVAIGTAKAAGIGSYFGDEYDENGEPVGVNAGDITIDGGNIYAFSVSDGAGIGGGYAGGFDSITINGGNIYAECLSDDGAGIGVGEDGYGGDIIINGGNITALSLGDDGAGIGGANYGYVKSITINGGNISVGSDDAAGIGGGQEEDSFGGKITINGGVISAHEGHDNDEYLIGNGDRSSKGATDDNFVQINGGVIILNNSDGIYPVPVNADGEELEIYTQKVNAGYENSPVKLEFSNDISAEVTPVDNEIPLYLAGDVEITNASILENDVNADGNVDVFDYLVVKSIYFEKIEYTDIQFAASNVNGDDVVDVFDYLAIKNACFK